jgi:hypothetical protein
MYLFRQRGELHTYLDSLKKELQKRIEELKRDHILRVKEDELLASLMSEFILACPEIDETNIQVHEPTDVEIPIQNLPERILFCDEDAPSTVRGTRVRFSIPFKGYGDLFHYRPNVYRGEVRGEVVGNEIQLVYDDCKLDREKLNISFKRDLEEIKFYLSHLRTAVEAYDEQIKQLAQQLIQKRKAKVLEEMGTIESLGLSIRRRTDLPRAYTIPIKRKKIELPAVVQGPFEPEPMLSFELYEDILEILLNMSLAMERSPKTFANLTEPEIRDFFLIFLNAHFEGQVTGETFNFGGKVDILIREKNKNAFIAECKFWDGEKEFLATIDQLLGYLSWRDTKTAVLIFNRKKDFSAVLEKIKSCAPTHKNYKKIFTIKSKKLSEPTIFPFVFKQPNDVDRETYLTIMAFDIPSEDKT